MRRRLNESGLTRMLPFDVILFDVGGVLLTNGWDHRERAAVIGQFHLDLAAFEARHVAANDAWERDEIALDAYLDATVFYEPRDFSREDFFAAMCAQSQPLKNGALSILREFAASGKYMLGVLNNEARATNDYRFDRYGIRECIDVALSSCYLGLRKPQPAIYKRGLDILGGPAGRKLFIDDRAENAAAAAAAGMTAIRFECAGQLHAQLATLGVF
jgi:putative hydrolase of the HAD superfamily